MALTSLNAIAENRKEGEQRKEEERGKEEEVILPNLGLEPQNF